MAQELVSHAQQLVSNTDCILSLWNRLFGHGLQRYWHPEPLFFEGPTPLPGVLRFQEIAHYVDTVAIETTLRAAQAQLNLARGFPQKDTKRGHVSIFLRDPISDRLLLTNSTCHRLQHCDSTSVETYVSPRNYDASLRVAYYDLKDKLALLEPRSSDGNRKTRGLTGWVAVSGHWLSINDERDYLYLDNIPLDRSETQAACDEYGKPKWGAGISEFPTNDWEKKQWDKRLLAVPVFGAPDKSGTPIPIGVLRYACLRSGREFDNLDLLFLRSISNIVSAIINFAEFRLRTQRISMFPGVVNDLHRYHEQDAFLRFLRKSLSSKVSSLYVYVTISGRAKLRLFDASGIGKPVASLRDNLRDYDQYTEGLTWELFSGNSRDAEVYESVLSCSKWKGFNTMPFYEREIRDFMDWNQTFDEREYRMLLDRYVVRLIGSGLRIKDDKVGVLKVEFPCVFDSRIRYEEERGDRAFFKCCSDAFAQEAGIIKSFVEGTWFEGKGEESAEEYLRLMKEIARTEFITPDEAPAFWKMASEYAKKVGLAQIEDLPEGKKSDSKLVRKIGDHGDRLLARFLGRMLDLGVDVILEKFKPS